MTRLSFALLAISFAAACGTNVGAGALAAADTDVDGATDAAPYVMDIVLPSIGKPCEPGALPVCSKTASAVIQCDPATSKWTPKLCADGYCTLSLSGGHCVGGSTADVMNDAPFFPEDMPTQPDAPVLDMQPSGIQLEWLLPKTGTVFTCKDDADGNPVGFGPIHVVVRVVGDSDKKVHKLVFNQSLGFAGVMYADVKDTPDGRVAEADFKTGYDDSGYAEFALSASADPLDGLGAGIQAQVHLVMKLKSCLNPAGDGFLCDCP